MTTDPHAEAFVRAIRDHQSGDLERAEKSYRQILQANPEHSDALHGLGVLAASLGQFDVGVDLIRQAIANAPGYSPFLITLGNVFRQCRRNEDALAAFQQALQHRQDDSELHNLVGLVLQDLNRHREAIETYRQALRLRSEFVEALNNLASAFKAIGEFDDALLAYERAIELRPEAPEIHYNLGNALSKMNRLDAAVSAYAQAIRLKPDFVEAHNNLGDALQEQGHFEAAIQSYERTLELRPSFATAYNNLGSALVKLGQLDAAVATYHRALAALPEHPEVHNNLANVLRDQGQLTAAAEAYRRALVLRPDYAEAHFNLGNMQSEQGQFEAAIESFRQSLRIDPSFTAVASALVHQLQNTCDWDSQQEITSRLLAEVDRDDDCDPSELLSPLTFIGLSRETNAEQQFRCARRWASSRFRAFEKMQSPRDAMLSSRTPRSRTKLRIGYLSADFCPHPVSMLIVELFERHAREQFEVFGYSIGGNDDSPMRQRLLSAFDHFRDLTPLSFREAAQTIAQDEIDILVDLQGYTHRCRTEILALRPAPIQVNYLGFPGTMGADFIDYILVDDFVVPTDQQPYFSERLVHLPGCFMVNDSQREIAVRTPTRREVGLPDVGFVFCAFNSSFKITESMFNVWLRLLQSVPNSVLWLRDWNHLAVGNLRRRAIDQGIASDRLIFAPKASMPEHLARHRIADLFLDTFPYNQHSTASDALRVGLPLITLAGQTFASRVAGSLLRELGLNELITRNLDEYENLAQRLAENPAMLSEIRSRLAKNLQQTQLYNGQSFARKIERAFQTMWERHQSGAPPSMLTIA